MTARKNTNWMWWAWCWSGATHE